MMKYDNEIIRLFDKHGNHKLSLVPCSGDGDEITSWDIRDPHGHLYACLTAPMNQDVEELSDEQKASRAVIDSLRDSFPIEPMDR